MIGLGLCITVVLLIWAFRDVSLGEILQQLSGAAWPWFGLAWLAYMGVLALRAWRWGTLLSAAGPFGRWRARFAATLIGFGASSVLPLHAGEFIRPAVLFQTDAVPVESSLGTIVVERFLDVGAVFAILLAVLWSGAIPRLPLAVDFGLSAIGVGLIAIWLVLMAGAFAPQRIADSVGRVAGAIGMGRWQAMLVVRIARLFEGLGALRSVSHCIVALGQTLLAWLLNAVTYWAVLVGFGLLSPGFAGALFVQSVTALAIALPSTPGYVGPFEAGVRGGLDVFGIPGEPSIAAALVLRIIMYGTLPIIAVILVVGLGVKIRQMGDGHRAD